MGQQAAVGEHGAFGETGRARGVQLQEAVVGPGPVFGLDRLRSRQPRLVLIGVAAHHHDPLQGGHLGPHLLDQGGELRPHEGEARLGVVEDVGDLVGREAEVHHRVGRPRQGAGQGRLQAGGVVLVQEGDPVAGAEPGGRLGGGGPAHPFPPFRPCPGAVLVADRFLVGSLALPAAPQIGNVGHGHRGPPGVGADGSPSAGSVMIEARDRVRRARRWVWCSTRVVAAVAAP